MRCFGLAVVAMAMGAFTVNSVNAQDEVLYTIGKTATAPVIDGLGTDSVWESAPAQTLDDFFELPGDDPTDGDEDFQVSWKALYDDTNLYVFVEVGDDEIVNEDNCNWQDDSIEIYIDAQNLDVEDYRPDANPEIPAYQLTAVAGDSIDAFCGEARIPEDSTSVFTWGINSYDAPDPFDTEEDSTQYPQGADTSASVLTDTGADPAYTYTLEAAFPWEAIEETPENIIANGEMGFGIAVNDDDDGGGRDSQWMWGTDSGDLWRRSDVFPSVALEEGGVATPGDFDGDGELTAADIDALSQEVAAGTNNVSFDVNGDNLVNQTDRTVWVETLKNTWFGDSNFDGQFNSTDFVTVFVAGEYEDGVAGNSGWATGDWNGDMDFDSSDFVAAFQGAGFEAGPRAAVAAVPEPSSIALLLVGMLFCIRRRR